MFGHPHDSIQARRLVGLGEQDVNLDRFLDVEKTLLYHGGYYGMSRAHARRRAAEMTDASTCARRPRRALCGSPAAYVGACSWPAR